MDVEPAIEHAHIAKYSKPFSEGVGKHENHQD
jgi:hypothetical protein